MLTVAPVNAIDLNTIEKDISPSSGDLGSIATVTLTVRTDQDVVVEDDLKETWLSYIVGTFEVDGIPETPYAKKGVIRYTLEATSDTTFVITFDVKVDTAYAWDDVTKTNTATADFEVAATYSDSDTFTINAFNSLDKGIGDIMDHETTAVVSTETSWTLVIQIDATPIAMTDAVIKDRFGAEIEVDSYVASQGSVDIKTKGNSDKVFLTWDVGDLGVGESATLTLTVSTDLNPAGHQEYSEAGEDYELNSGATLKFRDGDGTQLSAYTGSILVDVSENGG
jgi:hypothetical protein